ncbi:MAG: helix-turn-helix transcriptional regulator [Faecalimonas sp.]|nr:helix-turn-helix transcriptional regulator [Faecalimonas sp.]
MDFAETLKLLRNANGLTQAQLAKRIKMARSTIAGYEARNHQPSYECLLKIAECFDVSVDFLITGTNMEQTDSLDQKIAAVCTCLSKESKQNLLKYAYFLRKTEREVK